VKDLVLARRQSLRYDVKGSELFYSHRGATRFGLMALQTESYNVEYLLSPLWWLPFVV
jgi:hypothetical protein